MKPKNCCKTCNNFATDFKGDSFCYIYEDYNLEECEMYKTAEPLTIKGKWINDGDCMVTSCCHKAYDINKFVTTRKGIWLPKVCPNCFADMECDNDEW